MQIKWELSNTVLEEHEKAGLVPSAVVVSAVAVGGLGAGESAEAAALLHALQVRFRLLHVLVDVGETVKPGQKVAIQRNAFGDLVAEYEAKVAGEVATIARDALSEPGSRVIQILFRD